VDEAHAAVQRARTAGGEFIKIYNSLPSRGLADAGSLDRGFAFVSVNSAIIKVTECCPRFVSFY
jgi:hypothetical protein